MALKFEWYEASGNGPWALSGIQDRGDLNGYGVLNGVRGLEMPPVTIVSDEVPMQPGARIRAVKVQPRTVDLPIHVRGTTPQSLQTQLRTLRAAMDPTRGQGRLRVTPPDGVARELFCYYQAGWQGEIDGTHYGTVWQDILVSLYACDPYFYAADAQKRDYRVGGAGLTFLTTSVGDKFLPLQLIGSTVLSTESITNMGDVAAWPIWTITGPGTMITLTNILPGGTSRLLEVVPTPALTAGQVLTIDTRPGRKTIVGPGGVNMFGDLNVHSVIWSLDPGVNTVRVSVAGSDAVNTVVHLEFTPTYLGL